MGWYGNCHPQTKAEFIKELTEDFTTESDELVKTIAQSVRGNHLWTVKENQTSKEAYIVLYLMSSSKKCWSYKPIGEESGPYHYDCPKKFLKLQPNVRNDFAKNWREALLNKK